MPLLAQIIMSANPIIFCIQDLYLCADIKELENKNIFFIAQYCLNLIRVYVPMHVHVCVKLCALEKGIVCLSIWALG